MQTIIINQSKKEIITTVTQRGQVTIPAEVRKLLGTKPRDKVSFRVENGEVHLVPVRFTLASAYGSVKPKGEENTHETLELGKDDKVLESLKILKGS